MFVEGILRSFFYWTGLSVSFRWMVNCEFSLPYSIFSNGVHMALVWRTFTLRSLCVHFAFNLFVGWLAQSTWRLSRISIGHLCISNRTIILRILWVKRNFRVRAQISYGNRSEYCACSTTNVRAFSYGKGKSFQNRNMRFRVSQDFPQNPPTDHPWNTCNQLWMTLYI